MRRYSTASTKQVQTLSLNDLKSFENLIFEDKYEIVKRIGRGAQASIYLARKMDSKASQQNGSINIYEKELIALKIYNSDSDQKHFNREVLTLSAANGNNYIVKIFDFSSKTNLTMMMDNKVIKCSEKFYMAMEHCPNGSILDLQLKKG